LAKSYHGDKVTNFMTEGRLKACEEKTNLQRFSFPPDDFMIQNSLYDAV
jgi:hypothetical protein